MDHHGHPNVLLIARVLLEGSGILCRASALRQPLRPDSEICLCTKQMSHVDVDEDYRQTSFARQDTCRRMSPQRRKLPLVQF